MKRIICIMVAFILILGFVGLTPSSAQTTAFKDVPPFSWYSDYVGTLHTMNIVKGYGNGYFGPGDMLKVDELVTMTVRAMGHEPERCGDESYWACKYIQKAKELDLVKDGEFDSYTRNITRGEIARIVMRGCAGDFPENLKDYTSMITDYNSIPQELKDSILKAYSKGIITGRPDGTFGCNDNATRAEASAMIVRLIDPETRIVPDLSKFYTEVNGYRIPKDPTIAIDVNTEDLENYPELSLGILLMNSLEPQYNEVLTVLTSKFGEELASEVVDYIKQKTSNTFDLKDNIFNSGRYDIVVCHAGWGCWSIDIFIYQR